MSRLDDLIQEYCPDGVEFKKIGDLCETQTPKNKIKAKDYLENGLYPIIDQGRQLIGGYTNETNVFPADEYIIFGDHTCVVKYIKFAFAQGADGVKVLKITDNNVLMRYLYHCMSSIVLDTEYKRHWSIMKKKEVPLPALPVQREIVRILDEFTLLSAELAAELAARKKQYEYYRNELLTFGDEIEWKTLDGKNGIAVIKGGKDYKHLGEGTVPIYGSGGIMGSCDTSIYNKPTVLIPRKGSISNIFYVDSPFWNVDTIFYTEINDNVIMPKFLFHWICNYHVEKLNTSNAARPALTREILKGIPVPIPSMEEQQKIVRALDTFENVCTDMFAGLPAEIEARQKQYEYYRDQLLTFKELK